MSEPPLLFVRPRRRALRLWLLCLAFCVFGVAMVATGARAGWLSLVFAPGVVFFGYQLLRPPQLEVDSRGFSVPGTFGRTQRFDYDQCGAFEVFRIPGGRGSEAIAFDWALRPPGWAADSNRRRYGFSETIINTFGASTDLIVDELNLRRDALHD